MQTITYYVPRVPYSNLQSWFLSLDVVTNKLVELFFSVGTKHSAFMCCEEGKTLSQYVFFSLELFRCLYVAKKRIIKFLKYVSLFIRTIIHHVHKLITSSHTILGVAEKFYHKERFIVEKNLLYQTSCSIVCLWGWEEIVMQACYVFNISDP